MYVKKKRERGKKNNRREKIYIDGNVQTIKRRAACKRTKVAGVKQCRKFAAAIKGLVLASRIYLPRQRR